MSANHRHERDMGSRYLAIAVGINVLLTVAQVLGGVLSGSLSLIADALHNFSDAAGILLALVARQISRRPSDEHRTFGYARAEVVGALVNLTSIMVIAIYLLIEAVNRIFEQQEINGWTVVIVAGVALVVDIATAVLTYSMSKDSVNIKAAFLHNLADALASVAVIVTGALIMAFEWYWTDIVATAGISAYIVIMSWPPMKRCIAILMQSVPEGLTVRAVARTIESVGGVRGVSHVHVWLLDESTVSLECRVTVADQMLSEAEPIRQAIEQALRDKHGVTHTAIEMSPKGNAGGLIADH